jgi:hypothetical protein
MKIRNRTLVAGPEEAFAEDRAEINLKTAVQTAENAENSERERDFGRMCDSPTGCGPPLLQPSVFVFFAFFAVKQKPSSGLNLTPAASPGIFLETARWSA